MIDLDLLMEKLEDKEKLELLSRLNTQSSEIKKKENLEKIQNNKKFIGRCYKRNDEYSIVIDAKSTNEYHVECLSFRFPVKYNALPLNTGYHISDSVFGHQEVETFFVQDKGFLCYDVLDKNRIVLDNYIEISQDEFFKKMDEFYGELKAKTLELIKSNNGKDYTK